MSFAALKDPGLARWIDTYVAFPSTMVDRITPQTSKSERKFVEQDVRGRRQMAGRDRAVSPVGDRGFASAMGGRRSTRSVPNSSPMSATTS